MSRRSSRGRTKRRCTLERTSSYSHRTDSHADQTHADVHLRTHRFHHLLRFNSLFISDHHLSSSPPTLSKLQLGSASSVLYLHHRKLSASTSLLFLPPISPSCSSVLLHQSPPPSLPAINHRASSFFKLASHNLLHRDTSILISTRHSPLSEIHNRRRLLLNREFFLLCSEPPRIKLTVSSSLCKPLSATKNHRDEVPQASPSCLQPSRRAAVQENPPEIATGGDSDRDPVEMTRFRSTTRLQDPRLDPKTQWRIRVSSLPPIAERHVTD